MRASPSSTFSMGSHSGPLSTCPNQLRVRYQAVMNSPCTPEMLKLFKVGNSKPAYCVSPVPSWENHSKGICLQCPQPVPLVSWPTLVPLRVQPTHFMACPLMGTMSDKLSFHCYLSPDLLASLLPQFSLVQFNRSVVSDSLRHHESQHARPPCPSPTPGVHSDSCPSSQWCHPAISSSVVRFPPAPNPSQHQSLLQWVNSLHEVAKVLEFQL